MLFFFTWILCILHTRIRIRARGLATFQRLLSGWWNNKLFLFFRFIRIFFKLIENLDFNCWRIGGKIYSHFHVNCMQNIYHLSWYTQFWHEYEMKRASKGEETFVFVHNTIHLTNPKTHTHNLNSTTSIVRACLEISLIIQQPLVCT